MPSSPFFSIIVPVYNVEKYVAACINSILSQTFQDFQLIIVDDGSTDNSLAVVREVENNDPRIHIISQKNKGLSAARNAGIAVANGKFVFFLDSDDYVSSTALSILYSVIEKNDNIDLLAFSAHSFLEGNQENRIDILERYNTLYARNYLHEGLYSGVEYYHIMSENQNFVGSACLYTVKLSLLKEHHISFLDGIIHEDELFSRKLLQHIQTMYYLPNQIYFRRIVEESTTQKQMSKYRVYSLIVVAENIYTLFRTYRDNQLRKDAIEQYHFAWRKFLVHFPDDQKLANRFLFSSLFFLSNDKEKIISCRFPRLYFYYAALKYKISRLLS